MSTTPQEPLYEAIETLQQRGVDYDSAAGERSMAHTVDILNTITGNKLTEYEGWIFMVALKLARVMANHSKRDTYVDAIAYLALAGECALSERYLVLNEDQE